MSVTRKVISLFSSLLLLALATFAQGQSTSVQVTAEMGGTFAGGSITAIQVNPKGNATPGTSWFFDTSGNVTMVLPGGTWQFRFCSSADICYNASHSFSAGNFDMTAIFTSAITSGGGSTVSINGVAATTPNFTTSSFAVFNLVGSTVTVTPGTSVPATSFTPAGTNGHCVVWGAAGALGDSGVVGCSGGGGVAGVEGSIQVNHSSAFSAVTGFTFDSTTSPTILNIPSSIGVKGPAPWYDAREYNAIPYSTPTATESTTANCTGGTNACTLGAPKHFVTGEGVVAYGGGAATTQSTPAAPTVVGPSVTGTSTFHYTCTGIDALGGLVGGSQATFSTAPAVFGAPQKVISSITQVSGTVTVNATGINAAAGESVSISGITGAGAGFNGTWLVATGAANSLTFALPGNAGAGTVSGSSLAQLVNTHNITAYTRTSDGVIHITTDAAHNFTASGTNQPTLAIINGASPLDFNGTYAVLTASGNTMTLQSAILPTTTETGSSTTGFTTVTVYEQIIVTCPAISAPTVNYAVYGDSPNGGSTVTYLGETMYGQRTFVDWGAFLAGTPQQRGYVPTTPLGSGVHQAQLYVGTIASGGGTTSITVSPNITTTTSSAIVHDESQGIQAALNAASANGGGTVYVSPAPIATCQYALNYPLTIPANVNLELGAAILGNEPVTRNAYNKITGDPLGGCNTASNQFSNRTYMQWSGAAKEFIHGATTDQGSTVSGILFTSIYNGQNFLVFDGQAGGYDNVLGDYFNPSVLGASGTDIAITYIGGPNGDSSHHVTDIGGILVSPLGQGGPAGTQTGIMPFTPPQIPSIWLRGSDAGGGQFVGGSQFTVDGKNTLSGRGILYDTTFCSNCTGTHMEVSNIWNQGATTPTLMFYGNDGGLIYNDITLRRIQQDTAQIACFGDWARLNGPTVIDNCQTSGGPGIGLVTGNTTPQLTVYGLIPLDSVGQNTSYISFPSQGNSALVVNTPNFILDSAGNATVANLTVNGTIAILPVAPILWKSVEGSCTGAQVGYDVECIGDSTTHGILESDNGGAFLQRPKVSGTPTVGDSLVVSSLNPLVLTDSGNGPLPTLYLTSPYTNATTTFSNVGLSFSAAANTNYKLRCDLDYQTSATTANIKVQWTGPAAATAITYDMIAQVTSSSLSSSVATVFSTALSESGTPTINTNLPLSLTLTLLNGPNVGSVALQAAATGAGTITIIPGSCVVQR